MLSRFMKEAYVVIGNIGAGGTYTLTNVFNDSRILFSFECADPNAVPIVTRVYTSGGRTYSEALKLFGRSSGKMLAMVNTATVDTESSVLTFSTAVNNLTVYYKQEVEMLYQGAAVGPVSISTMGEFSVAPFSVAILCKPLFLEPRPSLVYYKGPTGLATGLTTWIAGLVGQYEYAATESTINKEVKCQIVYAYSTVANIGKVVSATPLIATDTAIKYTTVATLTVGIPEFGYQDPVIVGAENLSNYTKRAYVPRRGSHDELGYVPMEPIVLTCDSLNKVQASGRLSYEHSSLLLGEPAASKYIVTAFCLEGAGNVSIYTNAQEYAELPEYEY